MAAVVPYSEGSKALIEAIESVDPIQQAAWGLLGRAHRIDGQTVISPISLLRASNEPGGAVLSLALDPPSGETQTELEDTPDPAPAIASEPTTEQDAPEEQTSSSAAEGVSAGLERVEQLADRLTIFAERGRLVVSGEERTQLLEIAATLDAAGLSVLATQVRGVAQSARAEAADTLLRARYVVELHRQVFAR